MADAQKDFGDSNSSEEVFPGTLRGYRYWRLDSLGGLTGVVKSNYFWLPYTTALCPYSDTHMREVRSFTFQVPYYDDYPTITNDSIWYHGSAPARKCGCGLYAWYNPSGAIENHGNSHIGLSNSCELVLGVIEASGKIIPGTKGFRAEKAQIVALAPAMVPTAIACLRKQYPEVEILSQQKMIEKYPPHNSDRWRQPAAEIDFEQVSRDVHQLQVLISETTKKLNCSQYDLKWIMCIDHLNFVDSYLGYAYIPGEGKPRLLGIEIEVNPHSSTIRLEKK